MRRKDLLIETKEEIIKILEDARVLHVAFSDEKYPYIVPLNYGYVYEDDVLKLYFHSALEGRKVTLARTQAMVGIEIDTDHSVYYGCKVLEQEIGNEKHMACGYTNAYGSIIGGGRICEITDAAEKKISLNTIMRHYTGRDDWEMAPEMLKKTAVFCIEVNELRAKRHD